MSKFQCNHYRNVCTCTDTLGTSPWKGSLWEPLVYSVTATSTCCSVL